MRISRLKLSGFKSFVEPAELRIEPGLTGVVGPNGCGKSNLLEAIRWVMGESSAKSMRGGGMEDVIFAGTASRPPRDFAEVVLGAQDAEGEPLEVVRRIERGAGSAYRLNGRDCRAKDVALVFADAATGAHSPALVSQGRIAAVIAAKPADRRAMLEEAAGIAGLHVRRRDAEQKLRATEANLMRLDDIMAGLDSQIVTLRRQARAAEKYRGLSEMIRTAEARVLFARWREAAEAAKAARAQASAAEEQVAKAQTLSAIAQNRQAAAVQSMAKVRDVLTDRRDDAHAQGNLLAQLTTKLEGVERQLKDLTRQHARLEEDQGEADRLTRDAAAAIEQLERDHDTARTALAQEEARRPALATALEQADRAAREAEVASAQATAKQAGIEAEWRVADAQVSARPAGWRGLRVKSSGRQQPCARWKPQAMWRRNWLPLRPPMPLPRRIWRRRVPLWTRPRAPRHPCKLCAMRARQRWHRPAPIWQASNANTAPCCATARRVPRPPRARRGSDSPSTICAPSRAMSALWRPCWAAMPARR